MGLGLSVGGNGGEARPYIQYDARAGRTFRVDRQQVNGMWESSKVDITRDAAFIADLANIKVGWISFSAQGPVKAMSILGKAAIPPRPEGIDDKGKPAFKQGFELTVLLSKACGGGPSRELSSNAGCVIEAVDALHDAFTAAPESKEGKLPIVKIADTIAVKAGQSTNYKPIFEITGWVVRPDGLPMPQSVTTAPTASSAPPATGSTTVAPPVAAPAPQPAPASAEDFG